MKRKLHQVVRVVSLCSAVALFSGCGGGSSSSSSSGGDGGGGGLNVYTGTTTQATISETSVKDTLKGVSDIFPSCSATGVGKAASAEQVERVWSVVKIAQRMVPTITAKKVGKSVSLVPTTQPADKAGVCGGTLSYNGYSHVSGATGGTFTFPITFTNYCTTDSTTGNKTYINGTLSAIDTRVSEVTTQLTANIPLITIVEKTPAGTTVSSQTIALSGFKYVPSISSGAVVDISNLPGKFTISTLEAKSVENGKTTEYKVANVDISTSKSGSDTRLSMSARVYRGTAGYSDLVTDSNNPLVIDSSQNIKSGKMSFTGANGTKATLTAVSGGTGQTFNVDVNGITLPGAQLKCN
jgi:hypothetical protein